MGIVIEVVLPVFGLIALGYLFARTPLMTEAGLRGLTNYTFYIAFSALLFRAMRDVRLEELDHDILFAYFGGSLATFAAALVIGRFVFHLRLGERAFMALGSTFSNGVGLGIPLVLATWGESGLVPLLMIVSIHSLILLTLATVLVELDRDGVGMGRRLAISLGSMIRHPVLVAIFAGLAWGATGLSLPQVVEQPLKLLADSASPCALVALGGSLATIRIAGDLPQTLAMTALKLLLLPAIVWVLAQHVIGLPPLWVAVATLNAALPAGANVPLQAQRYGIYVARSTSVVLVSTGLSVVTLSALLAFFADGR